MTLSNYIAIVYKHWLILFRQHAQNLFHAELNLLLMNELKSFEQVVSFSWHYCPWSQQALQNNSKPFVSIMCNVGHGCQPYRKRHQIIYSTGNRDDTAFIQMKLDLAIFIKILKYRTGVGEAVLIPGEVLLVRLMLI